jgi:hypothetical protein
MAAFPTEEPAALKEHSAWVATAEAAATQAAEAAAVVFTAAAVVAQLWTPVAMAQVPVAEREAHHLPALHWSLLRFTRWVFALEVDWQ